MLRAVLSNSRSLCWYLQGKTVDVISTRRNADMTIQTLRRCRSEEGSNSVWQIVSTMGLKVKKWLNNSPFELREARALRQTPLRSLQDLVGDHVQRQTRLTPESHHRMNSYYASIDKVLTELELRVNRNSLCFVKYLLLWNTRYSVRYIFTSKVCFCVLMAQIVGSCCVVKIKNDIFLSLLVCSRKWCFY